MIKSSKLSSLEIMTPRKPKNGAMIQAKLLSNCCRRLIRTLSLLQTWLSCKKVIVDSTWVQAAFGILKMMAISVRNILSRTTMSLSMFSVLPDSEDQGNKIYQWNMSWLHKPWLALSTCLLIMNVLDYGK